jgi:hypothetical protein
MATWHQLKSKSKLYHPTQWTVVIDPPNEMRWMYLASTRELAEVYMRNLQANNPEAYRFAYILKPVGETNG